MGLLLNAASQHPRGGGYSIYPCVGKCGLAPHTLTLFKTKIADFPILFKKSSPPPTPGTAPIKTDRGKHIQRQENFIITTVS